jgi:uncharacterized protein (DUF885 family)
VKKYVSFVAMILSMAFIAAGCATAQPSSQPEATQPPNTATPTATQTATAIPTPPSVPEIVTGLTGLPFDEFIDESYRQLQLRDPDNLITNGFAEVYGVAADDQFTDLSQATLHETEQLESAVQDLLRSYDRDSLTPDQQISYDCYAWYLDILVQGHAYTNYKFLVNPVWGVQNSPVDLLFDFSLESKQDVEDYIARLASLESWGAAVVEGLALNEQAGAIPPKYVLEDTIAQIDMLLNAQGGELPEAKNIEAYTNFQNKINRMNGITEEEKVAYLAAVEKEVEESFIPAYQALKDELASLAAAAIEDSDAWKLPSGEAYYAYQLAAMTGTDLTADEIHALGLAEVARIQGEIRNAAIDLGLPADISMAELNQRISEESPMLSGEALLKKYEQILASADEASQAYFDLRPSAGIVIREDANSPLAYYAAPKPGVDEPGVMPVNLDISPQLVNYNEYVLVHHETIPGHYIQITLAQELDVPNIQRYYAVNPYLQKYAFEAYVEGWALYAEGLGWEMGLYEGEAWANLGRLRLSLLRAVRTVVDTGIHAKGWTLDEAADYLEEVTGMPQTRAKLTRYLVNPGYPTGYFIGWVKIKELRQQAEEQLGEDFDIQAFHDAILSHGILPIQVMEQVVREWMAAQQTS